MLISVQRAAILSPDRRYRYALFRSWEDVGNGRIVNFVGLNPSTADENSDDPTVRRCIRFAREWGYSGMTLTNLYAWRATDWHELLRAGDPVGPDNLRHVTEQAQLAARVIVAWGSTIANVSKSDIARQVFDMLAVLGKLPSCLGVTQGGHPRHPLYLPASASPRLFSLSLEEFPEPRQEVAHA